GTFGTTYTKLLFSAGKTTKPAGITDAKASAVLPDEITHLSQPTKLGRTELRLLGWYAYHAIVRSCRIPGTRKTGRRLDRGAPGYGARLQILESRGYIARPGIGQIRD